MGRKKGSRNKSANVVTDIYNDLTNLSNENTETQTFPPAETGEEIADTGSTENVASASDDIAAETNLQDQYKESLKYFDSVVDNAKAAQPAPGTPEKRGRKSKAEVAQEKVKVPGRLFALMVDRVMANGLALVDTFTNKDASTLIPAQWLMADDKTLDELAPVASMSAAELGIEEHPTITLGMLLLSNQLSQFMALKAMIRQEKKRNPEFDVLDLKPNGK
jgi:hypothetical protein